MLYRYVLCTGWLSEHLIRHPMEKTSKKSKQKMKQIRTACAHDKQVITDLRITEFNRSRDFKLLKPERLHWNETDDTHTVLGVWGEDGSLIATLRLIRVNHVQEARERLEADMPVEIRFPCLIFNSAATRQACHRRGFNQLLRYHAIQAAQTNQIRCLLSPVYQTAPRVMFMEKLGYRFHVLTHTWQTKLAPYSPRILGILENEQFPAAMDLLQNSIPHLIDTYPWTGEPIVL